MFQTSLTSAICAEIFSSHMINCGIEALKLFNGLNMTCGKKKKIIKLIDIRSRPHASYLKAIFHLTPSSYQLSAKICILCKLFNLHFHVFSLVFQVNYELQVHDPSFYSRLR